MNTTTDTLDLEKNRARIVVMPDGRDMLVTYDPSHGTWALMYRHPGKTDDDDKFEPVPSVSDGTLVWLSTKEALDLLMDLYNTNDVGDRTSFAEILWEVRTSKSLDE